MKRMEKFSNLVEEKACEKQAQVNAELKKVNDIREHFMPKSVHLFIKVSEKSLNILTFMLGL